jgi:hypothetical protein
LPGYNSETDRRIIIPNGWQRLEKETIIFAHCTTLKFEGKMQLMLNVIFGDIESSEAYTVSDTLHQMTQTVSGIVADFEKRFAPID